MGFSKLLWNPRFKSLISSFLKEMEDMFFTLHKIMRVTCFCVSCGNFEVILFFF